MQFPPRESLFRARNERGAKLRSRHDVSLCGIAEQRENPVRPITADNALSSLSPQAPASPSLWLGKFLGKSGGEAARRERWTGAAAIAGIFGGPAAFPHYELRTRRNDGYRCFVLTPCTRGDLSLSPVPGGLSRAASPRGRRFLFALLIVRSYLAMWILPVILARSSRAGKRGVFR